MNSKNLFVWNRDRFFIISKNPDYSIRFQYFKMDIRVHGWTNKEIPRKKRKVDSLSTIFSPTPSFNQRKKGFNLLLEQAIVNLVLMSWLGIDSVPMGHKKRKV